MKPKSANLLLLASVFVSVTGKSSAADITKNNVLDNLNLGSSWVGGAAPGTGDVAVWNSTSSLSNLLGADQSWRGIRVTNTGASAAIGAGNVLTLGSGGIDMSTATGDFSIGSGLTLLQNTSQNWQIASGRALTISGALVGGNGGVAHVTNAGTINVSSGTASSRLSFMTLNGVDVAALDASKNLVNATSVFAYLNPAGGSTSGTQVGIDVLTTTAGATQAYRHSNSLTVTNGVRFNAANTQASSWTVDTSSAGRVGTLPHIIVTSNVGAQDVIYNGLGGIRAATSSGELFLHQLNASGKLIFNTTINANGASSLTKTGAGAVVIASASGYTGVTRINEGTFQLGNGGTLGSVGSTSIVNNGNLAFNRTDVIAAGYNISGTGSVTQAGTGTVSLTGTNTYTGATNFNGGTVSFNSLSNFGNGTALNFNGGTLSWNGVTTDISTRTVTLGAGGGNFNTNGNNVTLANSIGNGGTGGLVKSGTGTLTLNGGSYTGNSTVTGGTLVANGAMAGGAAVDAGGTLGGSATYAGTVTVNSGGIIAPGNSVGTITAGGLVLGTGSILNFEFNNTPANDYINVTGTNGLVINGGGFNLYQEGTTNAFSTVGTYNLIGYSGTIGGAGVGSLAVLNPQAGKNYGFGSTGSNVTLGITDAGVISDWNVDADGSWNTSGNWTGEIPDGSGETGNFSKSLTASRVVTLDGTKTLGGISFNGGAAPLGYTIAQGTSGHLALDNGANQANVIVTTGTNAISADVSVNSATAVVAVASGASLSISGSVGGTGGLVKSGSGTLDLTGTSNGYDGDTTLAGGTLGFAGLGSLGDGNVAFDGGTLRYLPGNTADISAKTVTLASNGGTINTNGNDVTLANSIGNNGSGSLVKTGNGTLTLGGANTYTGTTSINGGTLAISSNANLGAAATGSAVAINGGTLNNTVDVALDNSGANFRNLNIGAAGATIKTDGVLTIGGTVNGSGAITKTGSSTLQLNGNNSASYSGTVTISSGVVALGGGQANGTNAIGTGNIVFQGGSLNLNGYGLTDNGTSYGVLNNAISIAAGQSGTLNMPKRAVVGSTLTGGGTFNVNIDGTRNDFQGNWSAFTGQVNLGGAGEFRIANFQSAVFNSSKLHIGAGVKVYQVFNPPSNGNLTTVQNIGELSGDSGAILGGNPVAGRFVEWSVGALDTSSTFAGTIEDSAGAAKLTKVGTGTLTLSGVSTYTGATTVSAGTLLVNGSLGDTAVTVNGGKLGGSGTIGVATASVTFNSGSTLAAGNSIGSLTVNGSVTLNAGSTFSYEYSGGTGSGDLVDVNGTLGLNGATLSLVELGTHTMGDKFTLFAYESISGTFAGLADDSTFTGGGGSWLINYDDTTAGLNGGTGSAFVTITAVPEPAAAVLGAFGLLALLRRRRI